MDCGDWVALISCIAAVTSCAIAFAVFVFTRITLRYQILAQLMRDYAAPQMGKDVKILWDTYRSCKGDWSALNIESEEKLNTARRPVSHFYQRLAVLHEHSSWLEKRYFQKLIFAVWSKGGLEIIPLIILPLEEGIYKTRGEEVLYEFNVLRGLYDASIRYDHVAAIKSMNKHCKEVN